MRLLVFGGTVFLSRAVAHEAVRRGHLVTCACRGESGTVPAGARHVVLDRSSDGLAAVTQLGPFDAVVDVARRPSWVSAAVGALPDAHWVFVSTISVYADPATPGAARDLPTLEPLQDESAGSGPEAYGRLKVACEHLVKAGSSSHTVIRPGLIIGPGDPSGRFAYWPTRLAEPGPVLAPGNPRDPVQVIDVRDLATWIVTCAEARTPEVFDGTGPQQTWADFLKQIGDAVPAPNSGGSGAGSPELAWVDQDFLIAQGVAPWSGPESVPLWLPQPDFAGFVGHDVTSSLAAGLRIRPLAESARDTRRWLRGEPGARISGIAREREAELLAAWRSR